MPRSPTAGPSRPVTASTSPAPSSSPELELASSLRLTVARLVRQLRRHAGTGLPLSLQSALATIDGHGPLSLGDLAAIEQIAPPTATKFVGKLKDEGLVVRRTDAVDRRVTLVSTTARGRARLEEGRSRREAWLATKLEGLTAEELERLRAGTEVLEILVRREGDS